MLSRGRDGDLIHGRVDLDLPGRSALLSRDQGLAPFALVNSPGLVILWESRAILLGSSGAALGLVASCNATRVATRISGCASDVTGFPCHYRNSVIVVGLRPVEQR
jgi:hypothetical protein